MRFSPTSPPDPWAGLGPAEALAGRVLHQLGVTARLLGREAPDDPLDARTLLLERAALLGHRPDGPVSAGGSCRLVATADGWAAVTLARDDDLDLLPAWLGVHRDGDAAPWAEVGEVVARRTTAEVVEQGQLVGLAVAAVPPDDAALVAGDAQLGARGMLDPRRTHAVTPAGPRAVGGGRAIAGARVVDLSSLWAGPLCGRLLAGLGADVVKVESTTRPDGGRRGSPAFFQGLNGAKRHLSLPLAEPEGRRALHELLADADVVIEGSRPRALEQLGIDAAAVVGAGPGRVWVSVTAYGRTGPWRNRVGYGDDAAAAGGLVQRRPGSPPAFVGDAVADPLAGLVAAGAAAAAWAAGGGVVVDVALREVARAAAADLEVGS